MDHVELLCGADKVEYSEPAFHVDETANRRVLVVSTNERDDGAEADACDAKPMSTFLVWILSTFSSIFFMHSMYPR